MTVHSDSLQQQFIGNYVAIEGMSEIKLGLLSYQGQF